MAEQFSVVLECWEKMDPGRSGLTSAEVIDRLRPKERKAAAAPSGSAPPDWHHDMKDAIEQLVGRLDSRPLGTLLRSHKRRIFNGRFLDRAGVSHKAVRWAVFPASEFRARARNTPHAPHAPPPEAESGEYGELRECFSPPDAVGADSDWEVV